MFKGAKNRKQRATKMNESSSRSHSVFTIRVDKSVQENGISRTQRGTLHIVDLAGSENIKLSGAQGDAA